jgi:hypothetical protein
MPKRIRVRTKPLSLVDETKLSLALWLLARDAVVDKTTPAEIGQETPPADQEQA